MSCHPPSTLSCKASTDRGQQGLAIEGLAKEPIALGYRPLLVRYLVTAGNEDDRQFRTRLLHQLLEARSRR